jgi:hypothetical protein
MKIDTDSLSPENRITIRTLLLRDIGGLFLVALVALMAVTMYFGTLGAFAVLRENAGNVIHTTARFLSTHMEPAIRTAEIVGRKILLDGPQVSPANIEMARTAMQLDPQIRGMAFFWTDGRYETVQADGTARLHTYAPGS